jgi:hypothetical protein
VEETMSRSNDQLADAVREAVRDGEIVAPSNLIALINSVENPIKALADWDQANELFAAFNNQFGFINRARFANTPFQAEDLARYASLLRWHIRELRQWSRAEDTDCRALVAALVAAQVFDSNNELWQRLPDDIGNNLDLIEYLKGLVAHFTANIDLERGFARRAEAEAQAKFKQADEDGDWIGIAEGWTQLRDLPFLADTLQTQSARFLYRYSANGLVQALANLHQTAVAMQIAGALAIEHRVRLALASDNPYLQLSSTFRAVTEPRNLRNRTSHLVPNEQHLLSELLLKVGNDGPRWQAWMQIFNKYPVRFPLLQAPLGIALAKAPDAAIDAYVNAIWLYGKRAQPDPGRRCVADCLRAFRANATIERRKALWTSAHSRWRAWNFSEPDPNQHMFWISWCDLDYALVGYACECMDGTARNNAVHAIRKELEILDNRWHASLTDIITNWNRLLSRLQPYAYASTLAESGDDWLTETQTCLPFDPSTDNYRAMKYRVT